MKKLLYPTLAALLAVSPKIVSAQIPAAKDVVSSAAYTSYEPVARGKEFQIAVILKIRDGYHINARKPTLDYLIPTDLKIELPAGFKAGEVSYPEGTLKSFSFSKTEKLNVYTGTVILRLKVTPPADAPLGSQHIPLKLRYQACSESVCLPPVRQDVDTAFTVAATGKTAHAEFFKQQ
ncbi:MAG TPA: protein-disulfide reductase DsbD N-terminal domain-containing protein [Candidatus Dormibacteraeota bacterium]|jgi:DsbC/DsbD-like thiol-disulfide interchange protein|nr:protein-disulfide reductase DsbD N-terminal domain-containing protein [Candidatus Dormibacteraeota bacterium]